MARAKKSPRRTQRKSDIFPAMIAKYLATRRTEPRTIPMRLNGANKKISGKKLIACSL
jgi:hypothetical protein